MIGNSKELFWYFDSAISNKDCDKIIKHGLSKRKMKATVGKDNESKKNLNIRDSNVVFLHDKWIHDMINNFVRTANQNAKWDFNLTRAEQVQFTVYKKQQFYHWHQDCWGHANEHNLNRKLSVIVQLTDPKKYVGGDLEFFSYDPSVKGNKAIVNTQSMAKNKGTVVVFPSYTFHRVKPVTKGTRYSLVNWIQGPKFS